MPSLPIPALLLATGLAGAADVRPNVLLITADDLGCATVGAFGCPLPGTTPNIDRLAAEGVRFTAAHVPVAVCQPSRNGLMTGCWPHVCQGEGFFHLRRPDQPTLPGLLHAAGYRIGILGKVPHTSPYEDTPWDLRLDQDDLGHGRNPAIYAERTREHIAAAAAAGMPFFLSLNSHDPHRPYYGNDPAGWYGGANAAAKPSRIFTADEAVVPGYLPDLPAVRQEMAEYLSSVRRLDDTVGAVLHEVEAAGQRQNTLVVFISDNGIAVPFAKSNCYLASTHTPLIVRWPGVAKAGLAQPAMVQTIDIMPTVLEACRIPALQAIDGRSFAGLLAKPGTGRDAIFTQYHLTNGRNAYPMRAIQDGRWGYIWNPWSDGTRSYKAENMIGRTWAAMQRDPASTGRCGLFVHRTVEELYDLQADPDCLRNRVADPTAASDLARLRQQIAGMMRASNDPLSAAFATPTDAAACAEAVRLTLAMLPGGMERKK